MKLRFGTTKKESTPTTKINWSRLNDISILDQIKLESHTAPVLIFKHSTRCPTSSMALNRLERSWDGISVNNMKHYYLDLISFRDISNKIASEFNVMHQSPQVLIISEGKSIYDNSHMGISFGEIQNVSDQLTV